MGQPVVHFEIIGKDGEKLQSYYGELFGWQIDSSNPMNYGIVQRDGNTNSEGAGIGGGKQRGEEAEDHDQAEQYEPSGRLPKSGTASNTAASPRGAHRRCIDLAGG